MATSKCAQTTKAKTLAPLVNTETILLTASYTCSSFMSMETGKKINSLVTSLDPAIFTVLETDHQMDGIILLCN